MTPVRPGKSDPVLSAAVDEARQALLETVPADQVGEHLGFRLEEERVGTHYFASGEPGYRGWQWAVSITRAPRQRRVTVDEVVLLPGEDALLPPTWVPWKDRVRPEDLGPGDLLPTDENDARLVPGYLAGDPALNDRWINTVVERVGLGRERVLSLEGRDLAAQRWYDGDHGPHTPVAQAAPAPCATCGFLVRLAGPLARVFGVCANENSPDDGRVVSMDHGCGAHSEIRLKAAAHTQALPAPVFDTVGYDDLETF